MNNQKRYHNGQSLVEVLVATGVVLVLVTGLVAATTASLKTNQNAKLRTQALAYAKEGMEILRSLRDENQGMFPTTGSYCLSFTTKTLEEAPPSDCSFDSTVQMRRTVTFSNDTVCADPVDCRKVTVVVSFMESDQIQSVTLSSYLTTWQSQE